MFFKDIGRNYFIILYRIIKIWIVKVILSKNGKKGGIA